VSRYQPLTINHNSTYDKKSIEERFDSKTAKWLLKDGLDLDPSSRYHLLRNEFDRRLFDALVKCCDIHV
jgi:hypothetical protein